MGVELKSIIHNLTPENFAILITILFGIPAFVLSIYNFVNSFKSESRKMLKIIGLGILIIILLFGLFISIWYFLFNINVKFLGCSDDKDPILCVANYTRNESIDRGRISTEATEREVITFTAHCHIEPSRIVARNVRAYFFYLGNDGGVLKFQIKFVADNAKPRASNVYVNVGSENLGFVFHLKQNVALGELSKYSEEPMVLKKYNNYTMTRFCFGDLHGGWDYTINIFISGFILPIKEIQEKYPSGGVEVMTD